VKANFVKTREGYLIPVSEEDKELLDKIGAGEIVQLTYSRMRNYRFHKKWFALVNLAYDYWEPIPLPDDPEKKWMRDITPERNFERFRKDITIRAGYYNAFYRIDGTVRIEAKSISWASMNEDEFEKLYSATIDVVLGQFYINYTEEMLDSLVDQAMAFAA